MDSLATLTYVPVKTKCIIVKYRTGTLYNQKHAVWFKHSISLTCLLCPQLDSALQILSGCQHTQLRNMITERHNLACSMTFETISKTGSLGSCFVCIYIGSSERLATQNLQIPNTAETSIIPKWLFIPTRFSDKNRFTSSRLDTVLAAPISEKTKKQQSSNEGGWVLRSGRGRTHARTHARTQLRETRSTSAAPPAISRSTFPRQHRPKGLSILQRDVHLIDVKYCEDTRLQYQLSAAQQQHKGLCSTLQGASVTLHTILLGVGGGTIYTNHMLEPFKVVDPSNTHNNNLATYHSWFAIPFSRNERMPTIVPRYLHLDLSKHVMCNISRLRLRAHTLKVEAAAWLEDESRVCDQDRGMLNMFRTKCMTALLFCQDHRVCELRKHFSFLFTPFLRIFSSQTLFAATGQQPTCS